MMKTQKISERDIRFDCLKGIVILIIILGHVMQFSIPNFSDTLLFNIIWSIQIPAFMVMSGYFSISSKPLKVRMPRKIINYFLPFIVYFFLRCYIDNITLDSGFNKLINHLEFSLWYIFVLFVLSEQNDIAEFVTNIFVKEKNKIYVFFHSIFFFILASSWLILAKFYGITFLGAKYVVYYSLFFYLGWLYRFILTNPILDFVKSLIKNHIETFYTIALIIYSLIILKTNIVNTPDTVIGVIPRVFASIFGVIILFYTVINSKLIDSYLGKKLAFIGSWSLELYFVHTILVRYLIKTNEVAVSVNGM